MKQLLLLVFSFLFAANLKSQCAPSFTWAQTAPNEITFTNTTTPIVQDSTSFTWFFGDNTTSVDQDPIHIYSGPDTVVVCMVVADSILNCSATFCDTVIVTGTVLCNNLQAFVWVMQHAACASCPTGAVSAVTNGGTAPFTYLWSMGDTSNAVGQLLPGIYSCTVTDVYGCTAIGSGVVNTGMQWPCSVSWNNLHTSGDSVLFRGSTLGGTPYQEFYWTFGDNSTGTQDTMYHEYMYADTFTVCLYLTDSIYSCSTSFCDTIIIDSIPPPPPSCYADLYGVQVQSNYLLLFNTSTGSFTAEYYWNWGDNTVDTLQYPSHVYNTPGTFQLCLIVNDSAAQCSDTVCYVITIQPGDVPYTVEVSNLPIGVILPQGESIEIYPVPAGDVLLIKSNFSGTSNYTVTDLTGRVVLEGEIVDGSVDLRTISPGIYFFTLIAENGEWASKRFVRE